MNIPAINTRYKGYNFRSRLEARWAVFFDTLGVEFEYEKEGYRLPSCNYLPDFWLPQLNCFAEVKPKVFSVAEYQKCLQLPNPCIMLDTSYPKARSYFVAGASEDQCTYSEYENDGYGRMIFCHSLYKGNLWFLWGEPHNEYEGYKKEVEAENAAKSARFEFRSEAK